MKGLVLMTCLRNFLALIALLPFAVFAQPAQVHDHTTSPTTIIDGASHPEMIPEVAAFRLYFLAVSEFPNATPDQKRRQQSHLSLIGLDTADLVALVATLESFKVQYDSITKAYNARAEAALARGALVDTDAFWVERNQVVHRTRAILQQQLTTRGMQLLNAHIQVEKARMKVPAKEVQFK